MEFESGARRNKPVNDAFLKKLNELAARTETSFESGSSRNIRDETDRSASILSEALAANMPGWKPERGFIDIKERLPELTPEQAKNIGEAAGNALAHLNPLFPLSSSLPAHVRAKAEVLASRLESLVRESEYITLKPQLAEKEDIKEPEMPETGKEDKRHAADAIPARYRGDPIYDALAEIEANPAVVDQLRTLIEQSLRSLDVKNPTVRKELRTVRESLQQIRTSMERADENQIREWSQQLLDHFDAPGDLRRLERIEESNPMSMMLALRDTPHLTAAITSVMEKAEALTRPKEVNRFKNIATETAQIATLSGVFGITAASFFFAEAGLEKALLVGTPFIPGFETVSSYATGTLKRLGYDPHYSAYVLAKLTGYGISGKATWELALRRTQKGFWKDWKFWLALGVSGLGATASIIEKNDATITGAQFAAAVDQNIGPIATQIETMDQSLLKTEQTFVRGALEVGAKEAGGKDGKFSAFGPKTVGKLASLGLLDMAGVRAQLDPKFIESLPPNLKAFINLDPMTEFEKFCTTGAGKSNAAKYRTELAWYLKTIGEISQDKKYSALGFGADATGPKMLQVLQSLFKGIDRTSAPAALKELRKSGEMAKDTDMFDQLASTIEVLPHALKEKLNLKDVKDLFLMIGEKDKMMLKFKTTLTQYDVLRGTQAQQVQAFLDEVARKSIESGDKFGLDFGADVRQILQFPALSITADGLDAMAKQIVTPELKTAIQIIMTEQGWNELEQSLKKSGFDFPLNTMENKIKYLFSVAGFYALVDVLPKFPVKAANAIRARRFDRELSARYEDINDFEDRIASEIANRIEGYYALSRNVVGARDPLRPQVTRDIRIALIRRRIREMADTEMPQNPEKWGILRQELEALHNTPAVGNVQALRHSVSLLLTPVHGLVGSRLGFKNVPPDVPVLNSYVRWLSSKMDGLANGDLATLEELVGAAYPPIVPGWQALAETLGRSSGSETFRRASGRIREVRDEMRQIETRELVPELTMQIELLRRGRNEILKEAERTGTTVGDPVYLKGTGGHTFTRGYVNTTYVLSQIESDLERYASILTDIRKGGVKLTEAELERIDSAVTGRMPETREALDFSPAAGSYDSLAAITREKIAPIVEQNRSENANSDSVIEAMRRRLSPFFARRSESKEPLAASLSEKELSEYVNELDVRLKPIRERFENRMVSINDPLLAGRKFGFFYQYADAVEGPTIALVTTEKPGLSLASAQEDEIAWVPFTEHHIPDFKRWRPVSETIADIEGWLAPGGPAERMVKAQLMGIQMQRIHQTEEKALLGRYGKEGAPFRIPLTRERIEELTETDRVGGTSRFMNEDLITLARLEHAHTWLAEHGTLIRDANHGGEITPVELQRLSLGRLSGPDFPAFRKEDYYTVVDTVRKTAATLQEVAKKNVTGLSVFYDPKPSGGPELIFRKEARGFKAFETRVPVGSPPGFIDTAIARARQTRLQK